MELGWIVTVTPARFCPARLTLRWLGLDTRHAFGRGGRLSSPVAADDCSRRLVETEADYFFIVGTNDRGPEAAGNWAEMVRKIAWFRGVKIEVDALKELTCELDEAIQIAAMKVAACKAASGSE